MHEMPRTAAAQNLKNETYSLKVCEELKLDRSSAVKMHLRAGTISLGEVGGRGRGAGQRGGAASDSEEGSAVGGWCGAGPAQEGARPRLVGGGGEEGRPGRPPLPAAAVAHGARVGGCGRAAATGWFFVVEEEVRG